MGNCSAQSNPERQEFIDMMQLTYHPPDVQRHPLLGRVKVFQNKRTSAKVSLFNYQGLTPDSQIISALTRIRDTDPIKNPCIVRMLKLKQFDNKQTVDLAAIYQFYPKTLLAELKHRIREGVKFEEHQLLNVIKALVGAARINHNKYNAVRMNALLVDNNKFLLLHPDSPELRSNMQLLEEEEGAYLSPQQLKKSQNDRSWIFSLGMLLLGLGVSQSLRPAYKEDTVNMELLSSKLKLFKKQYSLGLYQLVEECLKVKPDQRPSLQRLDDYLNHKVILFGGKSTKAPEQLTDRDKILMSASTALKNYIAEAMSQPSSSKYSRVFRSNIIRSRVCT